MLSVMHGVTVIILPYSRRLFHHQMPKVIELIVRNV